MKGGHPVGPGRWTVKAGAERRYAVTWTLGGAVQELEVSPDGWSLVGATPEGTPQRGERLDGEDTPAGK